VASSLQQLCESIVTSLIVFSFAISGYYAQATLPSPLNSACPLSTPSPSIAAPHQSVLEDDLHSLRPPPASCQRISPVPPAASVSACPRISALPAFSDFALFLYRSFFYAPTLLSSFITVAFVFATFFLRMMFTLFNASVEITYV